MSLNNIPDEHILVGIVSGVRGLKGELKIRSFSDVNDRFNVGNSIYINGQNYQIISNSNSSKGITVRLEGINNREIAENLIGKNLTIKHLDFKLDSGMYFHHQLIGINVYDIHEDFLGEIVEIIETGSNDVYVIHLQNFTDILIPALSEYIKSVDLLKNRMIIDLNDSLNTRM